MATNINIKQMNWSDYRTNSDKLKEKYLIYIQDKNFYIQHDPKNYIQATMTQYFIVYGSVQNITKVINAAPGLYLILENLGATIGDLWYHDGDKKWAAIGGGNSTTPATAPTVKEIKFNSKDFISLGNGRAYISITPYTHGFGKNVHVLEISKEVVDIEDIYYEPIICQVKVLGTGVIKIFLSESLLKKEVFNGKICLLKTGG